MKNVNVVVSMRSSHEPYKLIDIYSERLPVANAKGARFIEFDIDLTKFGFSRDTISMRLKGIDPAKSMEGNVWWVNPRLVFKRPPNVLLIVIDTLRADRLSSYGGPVKTPNIDKLAGEGVLFRNAYAHYPATPPSFASLLTGRLPPHHGLRKFNGRLDNDEKTLPEMFVSWIPFRAAFISLSTISDRQGFDQGFKEFHQLTNEFEWIINAERVNQDVIPWLQEHISEDFFALVHYSDPHFPYGVPKSYQTGLNLYSDGELVQNLQIDQDMEVSLPVIIQPGQHRFELRMELSPECKTPGIFQQVSGMIEWLRDPYVIKHSFVAPGLILESKWKAIRPFIKSFETGNGILSGESELPFKTRIEPGAPLSIELVNSNPDALETQLQFFAYAMGGRDDNCPGGYVGDAYNREVDYVDRQIGELLDLLRANGVLDRTIVILTADHGESFGQHDVWGHERELYDNLLHVPLIISAPWIIPGGTTIDTQVGLIDVVPTILDILELPEKSDADGRSLLPLIRGRGANEQEIHYSEVFYDGERLSAVRTPQWKLIRSEDGSRIELYDLVDDEEETQNLSTEHPDMVAELELNMSELIGNIIQKESEPVDPEVEERMRAMGYMQ